MQFVATAFLSQRERTSALVTALLLFAFAGATAGEPHRRIVNGHEIVEIEKRAEGRASP